MECFWSDGPGQAGALKEWLKKGLLALLPALLLCACTTTIHPAGTKPIADGSLQMERRNEPSPQLDELSTDALLVEGDRLLDEGNPQLARIYFLKTLEKSPQSSRALVGLGDTWRRAGVPDKARLAYDKALEQTPGFVPALLGLGRLNREQGRWQEAETVLSQALNQAPDQVEVLTELALTYEMSNPGTLATPLFQKVVQLRPDSAAAFNNLGFNYLVQERYADATGAFQRALQLDPENRVARNNLAAAYALQGQEEKALLLFEQSEGKAAAWNNLGYLYMSQKEFGRAEQAFRRALELSPTFYVRAQQNLEHLRQLRNSAVQ